jgi:hypothetical protein
MCPGTAQSLRCSWYSWPTTVIWAIHGNTLLGPVLGRRIEPRKIFPVAEWCVGNVSGWIATHSTISILLSAGWRTTSFRWRGASCWMDWAQRTNWMATKTSSLYMFPMGSSEVTCAPCRLRIIDDHEASYYKHHNSITFPSLMLWPYEAVIFVYFIYIRI